MTFDKYYEILQLYLLNVSVRFLWLKALTVKTVTSSKSPDFMLQLYLMNPLVEVTVGILEASLIKLK